MRLPFLEYLRPVGDFYIALLKICVLPFLLSTIPLAVRSAMVGGSAGGTLRSLIVWLVITLVGVAVASVIVTSVIFSFASVDEHMIANIGALVGQSSDSIDVEFAIDFASHAGKCRSERNWDFFRHPDEYFCCALGKRQRARTVLRVDLRHWHGND